MQLVAVLAQLLIQSLTNPMLQQAACVPAGMYGIPQLPMSASGCEHPCSFQPAAYALASSVYVSGSKQP
jgi:hypothetical protein